MECKRDPLQMTQEWFSDYFNSAYGKTILDAIPVSYTESQVNFILQALKPKDEASFLDLCCGKGRHALVLAKKGYSITAMDFVKEFTEALSQSAAQENLSIQTICQDVRTLNVSKNYDHIILMFTSFGYFSDTENQDLLHQIYTALKPGGTCLIDVENRDYLLKFFITEKWRKKPYGWLLERNHYYPASARHRTIRVIIDEKGKAVESERIIRLFSQHEILQMARLAKFKPIHFYGDYSGIPCKTLSPRIIAVVKKES